MGVGAYAGHFPWLEKKVKVKDLEISQLLKITNGAVKNRLDKIDDIPIDYEA